MYLFKVNKALYYYATGNRKKAIEYFEEVLSIVDDITLDDLGKSRIKLYARPNLHSR